jgi:hypothetical protein
VLAISLGVRIVERPFRRLNGDRRIFPRFDAMFLGFLLVAYGLCGLR